MNFESGNFYKESDVFDIGGLSWTLCIWSFEHENKLEISIKQSETNSGKGISKDSIIVLSILVQIDDEEIRGNHPTMISSLAGSSSQEIIRTIMPFNQQYSAALKIRLYAKIEYLYSSILQHIAKTPENTLENENLESFSQSNIEVILKYKYLNVQTEDQALNLVGK